MLKRIMRLFLAAKVALLNRIPSAAEVVLYIGKPR